VDKAAVLKILSDFRRALEEGGTHVDKLILFGSHANGTAREWSDIDVVVISKDFQGRDFWGRIDLLSDAIYKVFQPIEAVAFTPEEWASGDSAFTVFARDGEVIT